MAGCRHDPPAGSPLHEFVNLNEEQAQELAGKLGVPVEKLQARIQQLHELNPCWGTGAAGWHRLSGDYRNASRAICEAAAELTRQGVDVLPEIMVPLVGSLTELQHQEAIIRRSPRRLWQRPESRSTTWWGP